MTKIDAGGLEIKNVLTGLHRYQINQLNEWAFRLVRSRADLIREAVDLWLQAKDFQMKQKAAKEKESGSGS